MRFLYPLLFIFLIWVIGASWFKMVVGADPKEEAYAFVRSVESGNLAKTVEHFGSNVCRCPHKGGWGSYLIYASGQEPNLAFMTGHPFQFGSASVSRLKNNVEAPVPWQKPEDTAVDLPLTFQADRYQPLFLPLPMAYGEKMTEAQLQDFLENPDQDAWKGLTLRLRPSLKKETVAPPKEPLPRNVEERFKPSPLALGTQDGRQNESESPSEEDGQESSTEQAVQEALGAKALAYLHPKEAGPVVDRSGAAIDSAKIEAQLPRLKSALLRLHVVRRGAVNAWTIYHFGIMDPVLVYPDGHEVALKNFLRPSTSAAQRAARQLKEQLERQKDAR